MAGPTRGIRVAPYLISVLLVLGALAAAVFLLPGSRTPVLGLDLQGGTRVVLTPSAQDDAEVTPESLEQARGIIEQRVNGLGVAEAEVVIEGDRNIVVTAPGEDTEVVKTVGQTAELQFRTVLQPGGPDPVAGAVATPGDLASIFAAADCASEAGIRAVADAARAADPTEPVVSCQLAPPAKYLLGPVDVPGTAVDGASATTDPLGAWQVTLSFTPEGQSAWTELTERTVGQQVAIVLDGITISAPVIQGVITGDAQITGDFTKEEATYLANALNYGSLPLTFEISTATTVSATLGLESLQAGLIAGAIGLALVVVYCFFYYRLLGFVVVSSLVVSGAMIYATLVLLGRSIGFTLTLAGVAGFIVAIGITADSFVVYFERLKDEVRRGRSVRSAVPHAWQTARRTIVTADVVSLLASVILYWLSVGAVRGFAFTLGMSTVFDLFIVFVFTYPLVTWMSRWRIMRSPALSGLPVGRTPSGAPGQPGAPDAPRSRRPVSVGAPTQDDEPSSDEPSREA